MIAEKDQEKKYHSNILWADPYCKMGAECIGS